MGSANQDGWRCSAASFYFFWPVTWQESARIAVRILRGEPPSNFTPKIIGPLPPRYDGRELDRWKISEDRLPAGTVVLFREQTTWKQCGVWIIAGVTICLVQTLLIFGLVANLAKRRHAEHQFPYHRG